MKNPAINMQRVVAALVLTVAFLIMASVVSPFASSAQPTDDHASSGQDAAHGPHASRGTAEHGTNAASATDGTNLHQSADPGTIADSADRDDRGTSAGLDVDSLLLGTIESARHIAEIVSTVDGPRFTIRDAATYEILAECLTAEEVEATFPELPLSTVTDSTGTLLMLADPHDGYPAP